MTEIQKYIAYFVTQQQRINPGINHLTTNMHHLFPKDDATNSQTQAVQSYIQSLGLNHKVIESFTETIEGKKNNKWPRLENALNSCKQTGAKLIIAELGTLTNNESFSKTLLNSKIEFHCCDQPFVNPTILEALCKHAEIQRKKHGELIKEGLKLTSAKSGNPNAAKVISEVNKPKIDTAIIFAFLLQPIIEDYRKQGFSQRQMVKTLNEEGFTAPEGGKWVLSQLQKVLDRVKLNTIATQVRPLIEEKLKNGLSTTEITENLNQQGISSLKRSSWDDAQTKKLIDRIEQIKEIQNINHFIIDLLPIIREFKQRNYNTTQILEEFENADIPLTAAPTVEVA